MRCPSWLGILAVGLAVELSSCDSRKRNSVDAKVQVQMTPRTDVDGLERLINLPYRPLEVKWAPREQPDRNDWSLRALLRFSADDLQRILKAAGDLGARKASMSAEQLSWMPEAIRAETNSQGANADLIPVDAVSIAVEQFTDSKKSPLLQGTALVFVKHNLVYLGLYTM
jgi:hypothetical protein